VKGSYVIHNIFFISVIQFSLWHLKNNIITQLNKITNFYKKNMFKHVCNIFATLTIFMIFSFSSFEHQLSNLVIQSFMLNAMVVRDTGGADGRLPSIVVLEEYKSSITVFPNKCKLKFVNSELAVWFFPVCSKFNFFFSVHHATSFCSFYISNNSIVESKTDGELTASVCLKLSKSDFSIYLVSLELV